MGVRVFASVLQNGRVLVSELLNLLTAFSEDVFRRRGAGDHLSRKVIGNWTDQRDFVSWEISLAAAGEYSVGGRLDRNDPGKSAN
jgi:hypothetical protein